MSIEEVNRLLTDVAKNEDLRNKLVKAGADLKAVVSVAASMGYELTEAELLQLIKDKQAALSTEDLDKVAGGAGDDPPPNSMAWNSVNYNFFDI